MMGLILSLPTFADTMKTTVPAFDATLNVNPTNLTITEIKVSVTNQFCNIWGTTCNAGPSDVEFLPVQVTEGSAPYQLVVKNPSEYELSSIKVGNRFGSCRVTMEVIGQNEEAKEITGSKDLLRTNDKKICSSKEAVAKLVNTVLAKPFSVSSDGRNINVR